MALMESQKQVLQRHYERWELVRQIRDGEYQKVEQPMLF
jgi:hypothetical protein